MQPPCCYWDDDDGTMKGRRKADGDVGEEVPSR